jgi:hypothetical protein
MNTITILNKPKTITLLKVKITSDFFFITVNQTTSVNREVEK